MEERTDDTSGWGIPLCVAICEACDWKFLMPPGNVKNKCPHCFSESLVALSGDHLDVQPELYLPYRVTEGVLSQSIQHFMKGLWFPPVDLTFDNLRQRLQSVYLPVWLIDSQVITQWQAEAGFDYQVASHQDRYDDARGGWSSREVTETRVRWEARLGRANRRYQNIAVPALEEHSLLVNQLGDYSVDKSQAYDHQKVFETSPCETAFIRLNDRSQKDAWPEAMPHIRNLVAEDCRQACTADHIRNFTWSPGFPDQHWTLLLLPTFTTYYLDDEKKPRSLLIHGETGRLFGTRRASMLRARNVAFWMAGTALAIFIMSLLAALGSTILPVLLVLSTIGWVASVLFGVGAIIPLAMVWWTNRVPNQFSSQ